MHRAECIHIGDVEAVTLAGLVRAGVQHIGGPGRLPPDVLRVATDFDRLAHDARQRRAGRPDDPPPGRVRVAEAARREQVSRESIWAQVRRGTRGGHHDPGDGRLRVDLRL